MARRSLTCTHRTHKCAPPPHTHTSIIQLKLIGCAVTMRFFQQYDGFLQKFWEKLLCSLLIERRAAISTTGLGWKEERMYRFKPDQYFKEITEAAVPAGHHRRYNKSQHKTHSALLRSVSVRGSQMLKQQNQTQQLWSQFPLRGPTSSSHFPGATRFSCQTHAAINRKLFHYWERLW